MKTKIKILVSDPLEQQGLDVLKLTDEFEVDCLYNLSHEELRRRISEYDALVIRSMTNVTRDIIEAAANLKVIGRAGVGLDNVDVKAASEKKIIVLNAPLANMVPTAEHTFGLILSLIRHIPQAHNSVCRGQWERTEFRGTELKGKVLGVIGFGRIGSKVAEYAKAFDMRILAFDPFIEKEAIEKQNVQFCSFDQLLERADILTIHVPSTEETQNLISKREFRLMKDGVRVINCARGGIVNEEALVDALEKGQVAGCALDVLRNESGNKALPLLKFKNCIITPHIGAATDEAKINVAVEIAESVKKALLMQRSVQLKSTTKN